MPFTADKQKIKFSVSVTPMVEVQAVAGKHQDMTVIHEDVRSTIGGSGTIVGPDDDLSVNSGTGAGQWQDGTYTKLDSAGSGGATVTGLDGGCEIVVIKHMGLLSDGTTSAAADTLRVRGGAGMGGSNNTNGIISELQNGESMMFVRPGNIGDLKLETGNSTNHVQVQLFMAISI